MEFKIGDHIEHIKFEGIEPEGVVSKPTKTKDVDFLVATVNARVNGFTSNIRISMMIGELIGLKKNLKKLYDTLNYEFMFSNIESDIELKFTPDNTGHITISGFLRNNDYTGKLDFRITTDQTYLPETISEIDYVLNSEWKHAR